MIVTSQSITLNIDAISSGVSVPFKYCLSASVIDVHFVDVCESHTVRECFNPSGGENDCKVCTVLLLCYFLCFTCSSLLELLSEKKIAGKNFLLLSKAKEM